MWQHHDSHGGAIYKDVYMIRTKVQIESYTPSPFFSRFSEIDNVF
jgi:hypothetical protein